MERHEPPPPQIPEAEFEEILQRNKTVSSSAISRAVQDASAGNGFVLYSVELNTELLRSDFMFRTSGQSGLSLMKCKASQQVKSISPTFRGLDAGLKINCLRSTFLNP